MTHEMGLSVAPVLLACGWVHVWPRICDASPSDERTAILYGMGDPSLHANSRRSGSSNPTREERSRAGRVTVPVLAGSLAAVGLLLVLVSMSPVVEARVVSSQSDTATGKSQVVLVTPDGTSGSMSYYSDTPGVGASVSVVRLGSLLVDPSWSGIAHDIGLVLVVAGCGLELRVWWRTRHPDPPNKTLVTPGESVVFPPVKMPGGGMG